MNIENRDIYIYVCMYMCIWIYMALRVLKRVFFWGNNNYFVFPSDCGFGYDIFLVFLCIDLVSLGKFSEFK